MPTISATPVIPDTSSFKEMEDLVNSLNESNVPPNFPVHLLELRNNVASGGPIYNLLSRIIFWIGILLGIWPYR